MHWGSYRAEYQRAHVKKHHIYLSKTHDHSKPTSQNGVSIFPFRRRSLRLLMRHHRPIPKEPMSLMHF